MRLLAMDGCAGGWLLLSLPARSAQPSASIVPSLADLSPVLKRGDLLALDMPIGLMPASLETGAKRLCDAAAKRALSRRASCLFPAPARELLDAAGDYPAANAWHRRHCGLGLSKQLFNILPKIRELDAWLHSQANIREQVVEVHPELSFAYWSQGGQKAEALQPSKQSAAGRLMRAQMIEAEWPKALGQCRAALGPKSQRGRRRWAEDDLLDAFAALWSARRIAQGLAIAHPSEVQRDAQGLRMAIWA